MVSKDATAKAAPIAPVAGSDALSSQSGFFIQSRGISMPTVYHMGAR